jgi:broad specificity phosphatase PhoE
VATYPEAEEGTDVYTRVKQFLEALDRKESGNVVLVGHGASMTQAVRALCGEGLDIEVASVTEVERVDDQWKSQGSILPYRLTK